MKQQIVRMTNAVNRMINSMRLWARKPHSVRTMIAVVSLLLIAVGLWRLAPWLSLTTVGALLWADLSRSPKGRKGTK